jgi:hypothetical protein
MPVFVSVQGGVLPPPPPHRHSGAYYARPAKRRKLLTLFLSLCYIRNYVKGRYGLFEESQVNVNLEAKK